MTDRSDDTALLDAKVKFQNSISALIDPRKEIRENRYHYTESWYQRLVKAIGGQSAPRSGGPPTMPIWPAAYDKLRQIDLAVHQWHLDATDSHQRHSFGTVHCLSTFGDAAWRPQDTPQLRDWTHELDAWVKSIDKLLDPPFRVYLPYPCPMCGADTVLTEDSGEQVRAGAVIVTGDWRPDGLHIEGALCVACGRFWEEVNLQFLGKLMGCPTPDGVVRHADTTCGS